MSASSEILNRYQPPKTLTEPPHASERPPYRPLRGAARTLGVWLRVYAAFAAFLGTIFVLGYLDGLLASLDGRPREEAGELGLALGSIGLFLITSLLFARFLYRANQNARAFGQHPVAFSPSSMVLWFFVPIANLVVPFRAVRDVFVCSFPRGEVPRFPSYALLWWGLWVVTNLLDRLVSLMSLTSTGTADSLAVLTSLGAVTGVGAALLARRLVVALAQRQHETATRLALQVERGAYSPPM